MTHGKDSDALQSKPDGFTGRRGRVAEISRTHQTGAA